MTGNSKIVIFSILGVLFLAVSSSYQIQGSGDWDGDFNDTSVQRDAGSGKLGIGYRNGTFNSNITAFWRFDEVSGGLKDYSGYGNDGVNNGIAVERGIFSTGSYDFSSGSYIEVTDSESINPQDFTISAWINPTDVSAVHPIVQKTTSTDTGYELMIENYYNVPRLALRIQSSADGEQVPKTEAGLPKNEWTHVAATYDDSKGEVRFYIDGENQSFYTGAYSDDPPYSYDKNSNNLVLGASSASTGAGDFFIGNMDEVRIYKRSLSQSEIKDLTFNETGTSYTGKYNQFFDLQDYEAPKNVSVGVSNTADTKYNGTVAVSSGGDKVEKNLVNGLSNYSFNFNDYQADAEVIFDLETSNETVTPVISNYTLFTKTQDFFTAVEKPVNKTYSTSQIPLEVYSNRNPDEWLYSLDSASNISFTPNTTFNVATDGFHNLKVYGNLSGDISSSEVNFTVDTTPPQHRNLTDLDGGGISQIEKATLSVESRDEVSGLEEVVLATNETGVFRNKTDIYESPKIYSGIADEWVTSHFEWFNSSFSGTLGYRVYSLDSSGNWGVSGKETLEVNSVSVTEVLNLVDTPEWNNGDFNFTTADREDGSTGQSGTLGLGYRNGSAGDSMSAYWRFDSNVYDTVVDYSGSGNNGSRNGISQGAGVFSTESAVFEASQQEYVEVPHDPSLSPQNFTISAWIKPSHTGGTMPIVQKTSGSTTGYDLIIDNYFSENRLGLKLQSSVDGTQRYRTEMSLQNNTWYHVAARYNSTDVELYVNGERVQQTGSASTATRDTSDQDMLLGASSVISGGNYYNGKLDEAKIYSKALSDAEIRELYLNSSGTSFNGSYTEEEILQNQEIVDTVQVDAENLDSGNSAEISLETPERTESFVLDGSELYSDFRFQNDEGKLNISVDLGSESIGSSPLINSLTVYSSQDSADLETGIKPNKTSPVEGESVGVKFNFSNTGSREVFNTSYSYSLEKFNGSHWISQHGSSNYTGLEGGESVIEKIIFKAKPGPYRFNASIDEGDRVAESDETDNSQTEKYHVDSYQILYGGSSGQVNLAGSGSKFVSWDQEANATFYFSDTDSDFSISTLEPLSGIQDIREADQKLNLTGHRDSLENLYDANQDGSIDRTQCWSVGTEETCGIPVINSTVTNSFKTALFYLDQENTDFNKSQDIVMATRTNISKEGKYGTYDYEIKLPYNLDQQAPSKNQTEIYYELR